MITTMLVLVLLSVATATDIARHKIYNWTTYGGILVALGLNAVGTIMLLAGVAQHELLSSIGWIGMAESFLGFVTCGFLLLVCYVFFKVGGGDVKLIAMLGAFLGPERGIEAMLWTFVLGGCMGLIVLIWRVGPMRLACRAMRQIFWTIRLRCWSPLGPEERAQLQPTLFLAPSALAAAVIVLA